VSRNDWELLDLRLWLAEIGFDRGSGFAIQSGIKRGNILRLEAKILPISL